MTDANRRKENHPKDQKSCFGGLEITNLTAMWMRLHPFLSGNHRHCII